MSTTIRITTETHHDIGQHITYATTRPTPRTWHTIELDRHTIGAYGHNNPDDERHAITAATITHYCQGETTWHDNSTASAEPTPTARAIIAMKAQEDTTSAMKAQEDTTSAAHQRGQTIIAQIKADRARRRALMTQRRTQLQGTTTTRPTGIIDLLTNKEHSIFA